jgi:hypothetical protein
MVKVQTSVCHYNPKEIGPIKVHVDVFQRKSFVKSVLIAIAAFSIVQMMLVCKKERRNSNVMVKSTFVNDCQQTSFC